MRETMQLFISRPSWQHAEYLIVFFNNTMMAYLFLQRRTSRYKSHFSVLFTFLRTMMESFQFRGWNFFTVSVSYIQYKLTIEHPRTEVQLASKVFCASYWHFGGPLGITNQSRGKYLEFSSRCRLKGSYYGHFHTWTLGIFSGECRQFVWSGLFPQLLEMRGRRYGVNYTCYRE